MQKRGGQLIYSPSDLIRFLDSPYASWMERLHLEFPDRVQPDEETAEQKLVAETGVRHDSNWSRSSDSPIFCSESRKAKAHCTKSVTPSWRIRLSPITSSSFAHT